MIQPDGYATASRAFWQTINLAASGVKAGTVPTGAALPGGVRLEAPRQA